MEHKSQKQSEDIYDLTRLAIRPYEDIGNEL